MGRISFIHEPATDGRRASDFKGRQQDAALFGLTSAIEAFSVIDHSNADERRSGRKADHLKPTASNGRATLVNIQRAGTSRTYLPGELIFSQGDAADSVFYVERGAVKTAVISESGREAIVAILQ